MRVHTGTEVVQLQKFTHLGGHKKETLTVTFSLDETCLARTSLEQILFFKAHPYFFNISGFDIERRVLYWRYGLN